MPDDSVATSLDGERLCYLTTTGRVTGKPHEIEIWFAADDVVAERLFMLSGGRDRSDWVKNLRKNPQVRVSIAGLTYDGQARVIEGTDDEPRARRLLAAKYQGWTQGHPLSSWARTALPVAIELDFR